ncbi:MAG TPA: MFS transporter [Acidimicrobiales bacterium]|nr:MFS transporter [Acidimicrobiales bacterium]
MRRRLLAITGGASLTPILLLFGLNAVDELDRSAFAVLTPTIRDAFGLDNQGILSVVALVSAVALGSQVIIGYYADRFPRVRIAAVGAGVWGAFTLVTGVAPVIAVLIIARSMTGIGRAVNDPTHRSLLADYYPPAVRTKVYGLYQAANGVGLIAGPVVGGLLSHLFGWRVPFLIFWVPTAVLVYLTLRHLPDPIRGYHERIAMGASEETAATEEIPPSFGESWRIVNQVQTLKRIFWSLPFLAAAIIGIQSLYAIVYDDVWGRNDFQRGLIGAGAEPGVLLGLAVGVPIAARLGARRPDLVLKFLAINGCLIAACIVGFAYAPNLPSAIAMHVLTTAALAVVLPGILGTLSLVLPPKARAMGFSIGSLYTLMGLPVLGIVGALADSLGPRMAVAMLAPVLLIGAFVIASAGSFVAADIDKVRASAVAQSEVLAARRRGETKLLLVKDLDVAYDKVQVLFGVNFEVDEGEIVALLGTNGAGKSTLLRAISGLVEASGGAIVFDGQDATYAPPHEVAARGIVQVPGGKGVFPTLTVAENIRIAGWLYQRDEAYIAMATEEALGYFPVLRQRWDQPGANLSGGEQQMLTLAMAFIAKPRLLMIDELSLGLAPIIVEQLLGIVRAIRDRGTTIILVEQSVNVALTLAETAYFMEKGEIRFSGPTRELLGRPDILRSVFLEGAGSMDGARNNGAPVRRRRTKPTTTAGAAPGDAVVLEVAEVSRRYGGIQAVADVSFELHAGEILGVIGPNGAGKTTLFDIVSGFVVPDEGRITLAGEDVTALGPDGRARRGLGRSFQDARLFPALTVRSTIALALERQVAVRDPVAAALHLPAVLDSEQEVAERVEALVALMGLGAFADKFVSELSTGSRRIVDLACVLAHEPKVILFDEPSSGIAQRETEALGPLLRRVRDATGASLLVIEHDMPLVTSISDRMLALDLGQVVTTGAPSEVVNHPEVVASYLGTDDVAIARSGALSATGTKKRSVKKKQPAKAAPSGTR